MSVILYLFIVYIAKHIIFMLYIQATYMLKYLGNIFMFNTISMMGFSTT